MTVAGGLTLGTQGIANAQTRSPEPRPATQPEQYSPPLGTPEAAERDTTGGPAQDVKDSAPANPNTEDPAGGQAVTSAADARAEAVSDAAPVTADTRDEVVPVAANAHDDAAPVTAASGRECDEGAVVDARAAKPAAGGQVTRPVPITVSVTLALRVPRSVAGEPVKAPQPIADAEAVKGEPATATPAQPVTAPVGADTPDTTVRTLPAAVPAEAGTAVASEPATATVTQPAAAPDVVPAASQTDAVSDVLPAGSVSDSDVLQVPAASQTDVVPDTALVPSDAQNATEVTAAAAAVPAAADAQTLASADALPLAAGDGPAGFDGLLADGTIVDDAFLADEVEDADADEAGAERAKDAAGVVAEDNAAPVAETEPVTVTRQVAEPDVVETGNNNGNFWVQPTNWSWSNWPQTYTFSDTQNNDGQAQPIVAPAATGGGGGPVAPVQNAVQEAAASPTGPVTPEEMPVEESEYLPEKEPEESFEEESEEEPDTTSESDEDFWEEEAPPVAGAAPEGPGGPQLPFTGAPAGLAAAGAGLLAFALGCGLLPGRRRRATE